ncbi:hypothetical protein N7526_011435 [Penicillium atrosanguineum]|nr:hypothetical protein N7526_011435 [Penicillium atrosanguineum]
MRLAFKIVAALRATALFDCSLDKQASIPTIGKFMSHYTSMRSTERDSEPLGTLLFLFTMDQSLLLTQIQIRICEPDGNGWSQINILPMDCAIDNYTFSLLLSMLGSSLTAVNGNGYNDGSSNLN